MHPVSSYMTEQSKKDTFTTAGSQTKLANESAIPPVLISTPKGAPSPVTQNIMQSQSKINSGHNHCNCIC